MQYCMFTLFKVLVLKPPYLALPHWECQVAFLPMKFCTLGVCSMHRPSLSRLFLLFCDIGLSSSHTSGFTCKTRSLKRPGTHAVMSSWLRLHFKISAMSWAVTFLINWLPSLLWKRFPLHGKVFPLSPGHFELQSRTEFIAPKKRVEHNCVAGMVPGLYVAALFGTS